MNYEIIFTIVYMAVAELIGVAGLIERTKN